MRTVFASPVLAFRKANGRLVDATLELIGATQHLPRTAARHYCPKGPDLVRITPTTMESDITIIEGVLVDMANEADHLHDDRSGPSWIACRSCDGVFADELGWWA